MEKRDTEKLHEESTATYKSMRMLSIALILIGAVLGGALGFPSFAACIVRWMICAA